MPRNVALNEINCDLLFDMSVKQHNGRALANERSHLSQTFQPSVWRSGYVRLNPNCQIAGIMWMIWLPLGWSDAQYLSIRHLKIWILLHKIQNLKPMSINDIKPSLSIYIFFINWCEGDFSGFTHVFHWRITAFNYVPVIFDMLRW